MISFIEEGQTPKYGLNFYTLGNTHSIGVKIRYSKNRLLIFRYSKLTKKFHFQHLRFGM